ncbi:histidine kinase [uncultured Nocardioides sp.]|uniref:sensor histidine kinase n=1 Tax=uncultured Nocardioides sp. TaxID=198441 RepID=UPI00260E2FE8|nr:histidine kinase [uncultured Nocardioides sp.]
MSTTATSSSASAAGSVSRRLPRWRDVSQVRRADLYLRTSFYWLLWIVPGFFALAGVASVAEPVSTAEALVTVVVAVACTAAGTVALRDVMALHPRTGPLPWRSLGGLAAATAVAAVTALVITPLAGPLLIVVTVVASLAAGGLRDRRASTVLALALAGVPLLATGSVPITAVCLAYGLFMMFTIRSSLWLYGVIAELERARQAQSALAVAEERLRFSRDVHDVMGRRLSTIAVQAELASSLARRGDGRAAETMLEVRSVAHDALREARELARGYRETDLDTELEGARSLLASAGITGEVAVDDVAERWREPAAWVVREAVTNVLRHSTASRVAITWDSTGLRVADDGGTSQPPGDTAPGSGLVGLAERLRPLGARLEAGPGEGGFVVRMLTEGAE